MEAEIREGIVKPTLTVLARNGCPYRGFLYFGLMLTPTGPKVLEFNCRLGDPETQAIVPRMDFDLGDVFAAVAAEKLGTKRLNWSPAASVCVVMASRGYPGRYVTDKEILGLENVEGVPSVSVFHSGTRRDKHTYYTSSGRVLGVTAVGETLDAARRIAYDAVHRIDFSGCRYRSDIALAACLVANVGED